MAGARVSTRGRHALRSRAFAEQLVREAGVGAGDLVLDLGAGGGILTAALRDTGARVLAVELDRDLPRRSTAASPVTPRSRWLKPTPPAFRCPASHSPLSPTSRSHTARPSCVISWTTQPCLQCRVDANCGVGAGREAGARLAVDPALLLLGGVACAVNRATGAAAGRRTAAQASVDAAVFCAVRRAEPLVPVVEALDFLALLRLGFSSGSAAWAAASAARARRPTRRSRDRLRVRCRRSGSRRRASGGRSSRSSLVLTGPERPEIMTTCSGGSSSLRPLRWSALHPRPRRLRRRSRSRCPRRAQGRSWSSSPRGRPASSPSRATRSASGSRT